MIKPIKLKVVEDKIYPNGDWPSEAEFDSRSFGKLLKVGEEVTVHTAPENAVYRVIELFGPFARAQLVRIEQIIIG